MSKDFKAFNHGTGKIIIKHKEMIELKPVEIHLKENGSIKDEPSFAFVLTRPDLETAVFGQISLEMLNESLNELGYKIVEKQNKV